MLRSTLLAALLSTLLACGLLDSSAELETDIQVVGVAYPPDTLQLDDPLDWYYYPPIVDVRGMEGAVIVTGDYTFPCENSRIQGAARYDGDRLQITVGYDTPGGFCQTSAPKLDYQARVSPVPVGPRTVTIIYDVWNKDHFGGYPVGLRVVHRDSVTVH